MLDLWARVAEKTRLNICANNKGADQPARPAPLLFAVARFFSTKKRLTNLNGEQNDTWNLLVSHRIYHFRAIQPFDRLLASNEIIAIQFSGLDYKPYWHQTAWSISRMGSLPKPRNERINVLK